jgi:predicted GNAT family acetyltransferase
MPDDGIAVTDNKAAQQFEIHVDGRLARLEYERTGGRIIFLHTEVPDTLSGRGIGSRLAQTALDDARARQLRVIPRCPFVRDYIERHPEYRGLLSTHVSTAL